MKQMELFPVDGESRRPVRHWEGEDYDKEVSAHPNPMVQQYGMTWAEWFCRDCRHYERTGRGKGTCQKGKVEVKGRMEACGLFQRGGTNHGAVQSG